MPGEHNTFERIKNNMVNCLGFPANLITQTASLNTLGGDSLDHVELAILLEEEFCIELPDVPFTMQTPIAEIAAIVEGKITK